MSKFKSKLSSSLSLSYVKSKSRPKLRYVKWTTKSKLSYTTLSYSLQLPAPVNGKLFTYILFIGTGQK